MSNDSVLHLDPTEAAANLRQPTAYTTDCPVRMMSWKPHFPAAFQEKAAKEESKAVEMEATAKSETCDFVKDGHQGAALRPTLLQVVLICASSLAMLDFGVAYALPNAIAAHIVTDNSTLLGHQISFTPVGLDLVGSLLFAGIALFTIPSSWLVRRFGRRLCIVVPAVPNALSWALIAFAHNDILIFVGRFINGVSIMTMMQAAKIYAAEVANTSIRGKASSLLETMKFLGFVVVVAMAIKITWYIIACILAVVVLVYSVAMLSIPESPNFLAVQGREEEARRVLQRIRGPRADVDAELADLKLRNQRSDGASGFKALFKWDVRKDVAVLMVLTTLRGLCGCEVVSVYCTRLLQGIGLSLDHTYVTLMVTSALSLGGISLTLLVDRLGRRRSMIVSLIVLTAGYIVLGCYCYFYMVPSKPNLDVVLLSPQDDNATVSYDAGLSDNGDAGWVLPVLCFLVVAFGIGLGIANIPLVLAVEYFPTNMRAEGMSLCLAWMSVVTTFLLQMFSVMVDTLTYAGLYWTFGAAALATIIHTLCFIRETSKCSIG